jgi:hypothetical protein
MGRSGLGRKPAYGPGSRARAWDGPGRTGLASWHFVSARQAFRSHFVRDPGRCIQQTDTEAVPQFHHHGYYWQGSPNETMAEETSYWKRWVRDIEAPAANHGASAELVAATLGGRVARPVPLRSLTPAATLPERFLPVASAGPF